MDRTWTRLGASPAFQLEDGAIADGARPEAVMNGGASEGRWHRLIVCNWHNTTQQGWPRKILRISLWLVFAAWLFGLALFLAYPESFSTELPVLREHPNEPHNLLAAKYGTRIRASSYSRDTFRQHHPAYLCDGRRDTTEHEKWVSGGNDRAPWLEFHWRGARSVDKVVLSRPQKPEAISPLGRDYTITCLQNKSLGPTLTVREGPAPIAEHELHCAKADGLRVDFTSGEEVQLDELEVWGQ